MLSFTFFQLMEIQTSQHGQLILKTLIGILPLISLDSVSGFGPAQTLIFEMCAHANVDEIIYAGFDCYFIRSS